MAEEIPKTMRAVQIVGVGKAEVQEVPVPPLRDGYVLVKTRAVAINPTDWKQVHHIHGQPGPRSGCDYAGVVVKVGPGVTKPFQPGDRIAGWVRGADLLQPENGSYADYLIAKGDVQIKIPDNVSDEEAATLGISISTVGQGLYKSLGLPLPLPPPTTPASPDTILIHGGSTATGIFGIQFAKLSGLRVLATASPRNFDYLKSLGAEEVWDYKDQQAAGDAIREYTKDQLALAWDCTGTGAELCGRALSGSRDDSKLGVIVGVDEDVLRKVNPRVQGPYLTVGYEVFGEHFEFGASASGLPAIYPPNLEEFEFNKKFWEISRQLLEQGKIKTVKPIVNSGGAGLEGAIAGMEQLREGKVSAGKLVYTLY